MKVYKLTLYDTQNNTPIRVEYYQEKDKAHAEKLSIIKGLTDLLGGNPAQRYTVEIQDIEVKA